MSFAVLALMLSVLSAAVRLWLKRSREIQICDPSRQVAGSAIFPRSSTGQLGPVLNRLTNFHGLSTVVTGRPDRATVIAPTILPGITIDLLKLFIKISGAAFGDAGADVSALQRRCAAMATSRRIPQGIFAKLL